MANGDITIVISRTLVHDIEVHGEETFPEECCGALIGTRLNRNRHVQKLMPLHNVQDVNRERRFLIAPDQYLEAEKTARSENLDLLGFYHSHPNHPARPSEFDREHALPWFATIIVSVMAGKSGEMTAWELSEDRARFLEVAIQQEDVRTRVEP